MMDKRRQDAGQDDVVRDLPPDSAAAHLEALVKGIDELDVVVQGLLGRTPPLKPWQRQLRAHLGEADRHVEILRLAIALERDGKEIHEAACKLKQVLEVTNLQIVGGRADGYTRNALLVAYRNASLVATLLAP